MYPKQFEYFEPTSISETIEILENHESSKILAGGQSLIPLMKARITDIPYLVSLARVPNLSYIKREGDTIAIGSMTLDSDLEYSKEITDDFAVFHDALLHLADPLIRNMGTIGGNMSHGDPSNDLPSVALALGATMEIEGRTGSREVSADDFFVDTFTTAIKTGEILREIRFPLWHGNSGGAYVKSRKGTADFSIATVATQIELNGNTCERIRVAMSSVAPTPIRARKAESFLAGKKMNEDAIKKAAELVADDANPTSDLMGTADFKLSILRKTARESIRKAFERATGV
ncbi:MAG: xanthine dehydrogenase family protein subunit M [Thermoplasmatales archaeon]|nr:xanthine dehydrogenase family protein subunit M [Thermoplasmatales archaeon]MCW6171157.1 xanthine dehydrogenase family protein subunit M [Thermoplasmatales archaeon]